MKEIVLALTKLIYNDRHDQISKCSFLVPRANQVQYDFILLSHVVQASMKMLLKFINIRACGEHPLASSSYVAESHLQPLH